MKRTNRGRGRPEGKKYPNVRSIRLTDYQVQVLEVLSERWDCDYVSVIRRLLVDAGENLGIRTSDDTTEERRSRVLASLA